MKQKGSNGPENAKVLSKNREQSSTQRKTESQEDCDSRVSTKRSYKGLR